MNETVQVRPPMLDVMERNVRRRLQMFELKQQGYSLRQIGEAFGVSKQYVHYELKRLQPRRSPHELPPLPKYVA